MEIIVRDNATNFKTEAVILHKLAQNPVVQSTTEEFRITYKYITPGVPWHGGFHECLIKVVMGCLKKVLLRRPITVNELTTAHKG